MRDFLVPQEQAVLLEAHRAERVKKKADRIKTILLLHEGLSCEQISQVLFLDDSTIRRYETNYQTGGLDDLLDDSYLGGTSKLSEETEEILVKELTQNIYLSAKEICTFIEKKFGIQCTPEGLVHGLHRLGFVYKKPNKFPEKLMPKPRKSF